MATDELILTDAQLSKPYPGYLIDACSNIEPSMKDYNVVVPLMDQAGVQKTILNSKGDTRQAMEDLSSRYPDRIIPALKVINRAYLEDNQQMFNRVLNKWDREHPYGAMGEVIAYLNYPVFRAEPIVVPLNDNKIKFVAKKARSHGWPLLLMINFGSMQPAERTSWKRSLEKFLDNNSETDVLLIFMGTLPIDDVAAMLERHENIHFLLSRTTPDMGGDDIPFTIVFNQDGLMKPEWKTLIARHSERFVLSFYNLGDIDWGPLYLEIVDFWRLALGRMPVDVADRIAHGNAERLWHLAASPE